MKYKVMINGQTYKVSMSDEADYVIKEDKDIIVYTVDLDNQVINARIENPSQHTLYLISQGRCSIAINYKRIKPNSAIGYHCYDNHIAHSSGLGRGRYRFHRHWSLANNTSVKVTSCNNIEIPFVYMNTTPANKINFHHCNYFFEWWSEHYKNPERNEFYFDIRLALLSNQVPQAWIENYRGAELQRSYKTNTKITRLTFEKI